VFRKILVPLDGSKNAERALPWVRKYAAPFGTPVVLVRVLSKIYPLKGMPFGAQRKDAEGYLSGVRRLLSLDGIPAMIRLPDDSVAESIVAAAVEEHCSLILMTSRGASKVARWLIGGVTERVLRLSPVPVLVLRGRPSPDPNPKRILVPMDGSSRAKRVLPWAERLAFFHKSPLQLLYVQPKGIPRLGKPPPPRDEIIPTFARWCSQLRRRGVAATFRLTQGEPAREILADSGSTDLIAMTTHGYGGLKHWVLGSIAEKIIHGSQAPVFVFKKRSSAAKLPVPRKRRAEPS
jgi:nucleotide-binding universal stress UspA family protein